MKIAVGYDAEGNILTLFDPDALLTDTGFFSYLPAPGEQHRVFDLPKELEAAPFLELPYLLRVNIWGQLPRLEHAPLPVKPPAHAPADPDARPKSDALGEVAH